MNSTTAEKVQSGPLSVQQGEKSGSIATPDVPEPGTGRGIFAQRGTEEGMVGELAIVSLGIIVVHSLSVDSRRGRIPPPC